MQFSTGAHYILYGWRIQAKVIKLMFAKEISFAKPYTTLPQTVGYSFVLLKEKIVVWLHETRVPLLSVVLIDLYNLASLAKIAILLWTTSGISHSYRE